MDIASSGSACREAGWTGIVARQFVNVLNYASFRRADEKKPRTSRGFLNQRG